MIVLVVIALLLLLLTLLVLATIMVRHGEGTLGGYYNHEGDLDVDSFEGRESLGRVVNSRCPASRRAARNSARNPHRDSVGG